MVAPNGVFTLTKGMNMKYLMIVLRWYFRQRFSMLDLSVMGIGVVLWEQGHVIVAILTVFVLSLVFGFLELMLGEK